MRLRPDRDDPEYRRPALDHGPLFAEPAPWPEHPPAPGVEVALPIKRRLEEKYEAWRKTPAGELAYRTFCRLALEDVARGATRLGGKDLWERTRKELNRNGSAHCNNSFVSCLVRSAEAQYGSLRGLFEKRRRSAA